MKKDTKKYKTENGVRVYPAPEKKVLKNKFVLRTEEMLDALELVSLPQRVRVFIESLADGFENYGELTDAQFVALERNYNKYINGIPFYVEGSNYNG